MDATEALKKQLGELVFANTLLVVENQALKAELETLKTTKED